VRLSIAFKFSFGILILFGLAFLCCSACSLSGNVGLFVVKLFCLLQMGKLVEFREKIVLLL
jgi:hypothetical protein